LDEGLRYSILGIQSKCSSAFIFLLKYTGKKKPADEPQQPEDKLKARYDFGQSIHQAKSTNTIPQPQKTLAMPIPISPSSRRPRSSSSPTASYHSPSPTASCHSPLASSPSFMDLNSQSYMDLVNKYCFYSTSPSRSPMSING